MHNSINYLTQTNISELFTSILGMLSNNDYMKKKIKNISIIKKD